MVSQLAVEQVSTLDKRPDYWIKAEKLIDAAEKSKETDSMYWRMHLYKAQVYASLAAAPDSVANEVVRRKMNAK
jgi:hypothetical protein